MFARHIVSDRTTGMLIYLVMDIYGHHKAPISCLGQWCSTRGECEAGARNVVGTCSSWTAVFLHKTPNCVCSGHVYVGSGRPKLGTSCLTQWQTASLCRPSFLRRNNLFMGKHHISSLNFEDTSTTPTCDGPLWAKTYPKLSFHGEKIVSPLGYFFIFLTLLRAGCF